jgi:hypothetical protein
MEEEKRKTFGKSVGENQIFDFAFTIKSFISEIVF